MGMRTAAAFSSCVMIELPNVQGSEQSLVRGRCCRSVSLTDCGKAVPWVTVFGKPLYPMLLHWTESWGRSESLRMEFPRVKSSSWLVPSILKAAGAAGRGVEDPDRLSRVGRYSSSDRALGLACSWGPPSLPAAPLLAPGTHTLGVGTLPPARWHQQRLGHGGGWRGLGQATGAGHPGLGTDGLAAMPSTGCLGAGWGQPLLMTKLGFSISWCGGRRVWDEGWESPSRSFPTPESAPHLEEKRSHLPENPGETVSPMPGAQYILNAPVIVVIS